MTTNSTYGEIGDAKIVERFDVTLM